MSWSAINTIPELKGKPKEQRETFATVANKALLDGRSTQEAIFAGMAAVSQKHKPKVIQKQEEQSIPWHLKAVLESSKSVQEPSIPPLPTNPLPYIKNALKSDPSRSLVAADFDESDKLVLRFDDGQIITTRPLDTRTYIEKYISSGGGGAGSGSSGGLPTAIAGATNGQTLVYDTTLGAWKNTSSISTSISYLSAVVSAHAGNFNAYDNAINLLNTEVGVLSTSITAFPSLLTGLIRDDLTSEKKTWSSEKLTSRLNTKLSFTEEQELEPEDKTLALTNLGINFDFQEWYNSI